MQLKEIEDIKVKITTKIEKGDFITLSKIFGLKRETALARYKRNNEKAVLCMQDIVLEKEKLVQKLKKKYALKI